MRKIIECIQYFIMDILLVIGIVFIVILCYLYIEKQKEPEHNPLITVSKLGYLIIDGDTTKYVLKEVKAYKMERREK